MTATGEYQLPADEATVDLVASFLDGSLESDRFGHRQHIQVCWHLLRLLGRHHGAVIFKRSLQRLLVQWRCEAKYSEEITNRWLDLIWHSLEQNPAVAGFERFMELSPNLCAGSSKSPGERTADGTTAR